MTAFGWACVLAYQVLDASAALACSRELEEPFRVDPALAEESAEAPSSFSELSAFSYRISGTRCSGKSCTSSSCGDAGVLLLRFEPPEEAGEGELGYRAIWIGRTLPVALRRHFEQVMPLNPVTHTLDFVIGFQEIAALEGEISLVAVDRAGHESTPSAPVRVSFSGCTEYFDQPYCLAGGPMPQSEEADCSVTTVRQHRSSPLLAALALSLFTLLGARRMRRARSRCA